LKELTRTMDVNSQVGETAGKVWYALSSAGPLALAQLKKKVDGSGELLSYFDATNDPRSRAKR
jgi:Winged helix-turn-helix domain (DUF2582)